MKAPEGDTYDSVSSYERRWVPKLSLSTTMVKVENVIEQFSMILMMDFINEQRSYIGEKNFFFPL